MSGASASLAARFGAQLAAEGFEPAEPMVVAVSGGVDSVVLLHLLRFAAPSALELTVAHFDHRMRPGSARDAEWVRGLARAWALDFRSAFAGTPPASEEEARDARYAFLERVRAEVGARAVLTAHHADDQAETVLFRLVRGAHTPGLSGIPARREPGLHRPLLAFWREEIEGYAAEAGLSWREDPTNRDEGFARNSLRMRIIPALEASVAPGTRRALVRLAERADRDERAWRTVLPLLIEGLAVESTDAALSFDVATFLALDESVRGRVLRALVDQLGRGLGAVGTRTAMEFTSGAPTGSRVDLGGSLVLGREWERFVFRLVVTAPADRALSIPDTGPGSGEALLGGRRVGVRWGLGEISPSGSHESFAAERTRFPLRVRARRPGDRIRLAYGTKKIKKLFLERRVPPLRRAQLPLLADADDNVLWIPGVARAEGVGSERGRHAFHIGIDDADTD
jgi:tRNA(Ile)-lysidine synthase